jgi:hypothetical protein
MTAKLGLNVKNPIPNGKQLCKTEYHSEAKQTITVILPIYTTNIPTILSPF